MEINPKQTLAAGGIVLGDGGMIALVRNQTSSNWFFPKGHVEDSETDEEAARREIKEEAGLEQLEYIDDLGSYERPRRKKDETYDDSEMKSIHMFLFAALPGATVNPSHEIAEAQWFPYREVAQQLEDTKDKVWFGTVFERIRQAIQRD